MYTSHWKYSELFKHPTCAQTSHTTYCNIWYYLITFYQRQYQKSLLVSIIMILEHKYNSSSVFGLLEMPKMIPITFFLKLGYNCFTILCSAAVQWNVYVYPSSSWTPPPTHSSSHPARSSQRAELSWAVQQHPTILHMVVHTHQPQFPNSCLCPVIHYSLIMLLCIWSL